MRTRSCGTILTIAVAAALAAVPRSLDAQPLQGRLQVPIVGMADAGGSFTLPRLIGKARAMRMMMLAEKISADQALEWGMIHDAVPDDSLMDEALSLAGRLASGPTLAYGLIRQEVHEALESDFETALEAEARNQRTAGKSKDCAEAVAAFLEKRAPVFQGE